MRDSVCPSSDLGDQSRDKHGGHHRRGLSPGQLVGLLGGEIPSALVSLDLELPMATLHSEARARKSVKMNFHAVIEPLGQVMPNTHPHVISSTKQ